MTREQMHSETRSRCSTSRGTRKVTHFTPAVFGKLGIFGGGERYVQSVCEGINGNEQRNWTAEIVGFGKRRATLTECNLVTHVLPAGARALAETTAFSPDVLEFFAEADLVHIHQPFTRAGQLAALACTQMGKPIVLTDHGAGDASNVELEDVLKAAEGVVHVSNFSKLINAKAFADVKLSEVAVGPVGDEFFSSSISSRRAGVLYTGRLLPHKGIDRIIEQLPEGLALTVAGSRHDDAYYRDLIELAKGKNVRFVLEPSDAALVGLYSSHAAYCIASTHVDRYGNRHEKPELMGITSMEALASGCATAVAGNASLPEILTGASGEYARVFADDYELKVILQQIVNREWASGEAYPARARLYAERFRKVNIGAQLDSFYTLVLEQR